MTATTAAPKATKHPDLKLVEEAVKAAAAPDAPPPATMPILSAGALFIDDMRMRLRDAESDLSIINHQLAAEDARHQAALDREAAMHKANQDALEWRRDDVQGIVDRCNAALNLGGGRLPQPSDD